MLYHQPGEKIRNAISEIRFCRIRSIQHPEKLCFRKLKMSQKNSRLRQRTKVSAKKSGRKMLSDPFPCGEYCLHLWESARQINRCMLKQVSAAINASESYQEPGRGMRGRGPPPIKPGRGINAGRKAQKLSPRPQITCTVSAKTKPSSYSRSIISIYIYYWRRSAHNENYW